MNYPDAYTAAIHKLKLVLPHDSHVTLEGVLRDVYVAALEEAHAKCDKKYYLRAQSGFPREASTARNLAAEIRTIIEQVKDHSHG